MEAERVRSVLCLGEEEEDGGGGEEEEEAQKPTFSHMKPPQMLRKVGSERRKSPAERLGSGRRAGA